MHVYSPSPTLRFDQKPATYGTNDRAKQRTHCIDCHGTSALLHRHHVGNGAGANGDTHSSETTRQEAECDQHAQAIRDGTGNGENDEANVARMIHGDTTVHLTQRSNND